VWGRPGAAGVLSGMGHQTVPHLFPGGKFSVTEEEWATSAPSWVASSGPVPGSQEEFNK
jgi:hypothetical protein